MLGIGFPELVVILILLLIVFRPEQLVELVRAAGGLAGRFWQAGQEIREQIEEELARSAEWERPGTRTETPPPPIALAPPADPPAAEPRKPEG
ncbi:MAG TPA: twin-arginine translocase TatA/TatE family subunit [Nitrospiria bacterium]|nr:twin-arginine translocase TatA/TatE family subunit [Nitrospiria bacterium]